MSTLMLTNGVLIDSSSLKIGIDVDNLIASGNSFPSAGYTATEDCFIIWDTPDTYGTISLNNGTETTRQINQYARTGSAGATGYLYMKKGQKATGRISAYRVLGLL